MLDVNDTRYNGALCRVYANTNKENERIPITLLFAGNRPIRVWSSSIVRGFRRATMLAMGIKLVLPLVKRLRAEDLATSFKGTDIDTLDASAHHFNRNRS